ncbi:MAG: class I SAM-dependent methyltransferase [Verrucomicrobiota bacterium]
MNPLTFDQICRKLDVSPSELPSLCLDQFLSFETGFRPAQPDEREKHLVHVLERLHEKKNARSVQENKAAFEQGWHENYLLCCAHGLSWESLRPKYVKPFGIMRYEGDYVVPENPLLADDLLSLYAMILFWKHLGEAETIFEFGCGTGRYVYALSQLFPEKTVVGADWTEASFKILRLMAEEGRRIAPIIFDMLAPPLQAKLPPNSAVVTIGAMEQLGGQWEPFLHFLLENRPRVVLHLEPVLEFYTMDKVFDYLAMLYHRKRGYLNGYWPALQARAAKGDIEILAQRRLGSGDPYHESSSLIIWKPLP